MIVRKKHLINQTITQKRCETRKENLPDGSVAIIITDHEGNRLHKLNQRIVLTGTMTPELKKTVERNNIKWRKQNKNKKEKSYYSISGTAQK